LTYQQSRAQQPAVDTSTGAQLISEVLATADAFLRESRRLFRPHGLSAAQYNLLNLVADSADGMSQRELSDALVVDRSNVTGLLDRMEEAGWVQRRDDPTDRRVYRIVATASGKKLWAEVTPLYEAAVADVTRKLAPRERQACVEALRMLQASAIDWGQKASQADKAEKSSRR
jgi:MarR family 2-MHQ and catechol resistance regulon transcriptional repressor